MIRVFSVTMDANAKSQLRPLCELAALQQVGAAAVLLDLCDHPRAMRDYLHGQLYRVIIDHHPWFATHPSKAGWSLQTGRKWSAAVARDAADPRRLPVVVDAMLRDLEAWRPIPTGGPSA